MRTSSAKLYYTFRHNHFPQRLLQKNAKKNFLLEKYTNPPDRIRSKWSGQPEGKKKSHRLNRILYVPLRTLFRMNRWEFVCMCVCLGCTSCSRHKLVYLIISQLNVCMWARTPWKSYRNTGVSLRVENGCNSNWSLLLKYKFLWCSLLCVVLDVWYRVTMEMCPSSFQLIILNIVDQIAS